MSKYRVVYIIEPVKMRLNRYDDKVDLEKTEAFYDFNCREEALEKFYDLIKGRLSSYLGYEIFHDSPDYILPFLDKKLESEWLEIRKGSNTYKRDFLGSIVETLDYRFYDIILDRNNFSCVTRASRERVHFLYFS